MNNSEYDPSHKTSSVTSTSSGTSSIWDPLPSLYTGRANSVSSAYELDDLPQEEPTPLFVDEFNYNPVYNAKEQQLASTLSSSPGSIIIAANNNQEENTFNDYLNSFLDTTISNTPDVTSTLIKEEQVVNHEVSTTTKSHGNNLCSKKRKQDVVTEEQIDEDEEEARRKELLSNDQKKANHIASEQKRRNTIRGGFKELTEIIPTLKNINNSKSTILFKSVDYIKQLDKRNKSLRDKLASLQSRVQQQQQQKKRKQPTNQQKQLEFLQQQLRIQQELLTKHNIPLLYNGEYNSISIPCMDDTPLNSTTTSPILSNASLPSSSLHVNTHIRQQHHRQHQHLHHSTTNNSSSSSSIFIPADNHPHHINNKSDHSSAPSFTIPADFDHLSHQEEEQQQKTLTFRERLLSSGKLNHLRKDSIPSSLSSSHASYML